MANDYEPIQSYNTSAPGPVVGQGLYKQTNESLFGMNRDEMPSMIHSRHNQSTINASRRHSPRESPPPAEYVSRNQQLRAQQEAHSLGERSRSRPDMLPSRGPSSYLQPTDTEHKRNEYSPGLMGIDLRSNFGQRQREIQEIEQSLSNPPATQQSLRIKSHDGVRSSYQPEQPMA